ncbi:MAG: ATP-binding protein [Actinomycetota bacterium]|nr:ATP-binding protein [Actinomycetota bacterium]
MDRQRAETSGQSHAFEQASVALCVLDAAGRHLQANEAYATLMRVPLAELAGTSIGEIAGFGDEQWATAYLGRLTTGEMDEFVTLKRCRIGGEELLLRFEARPMVQNGLRTSVVCAVLPAPDTQPIVDQRLRKLIENITDTISLIDETGALLETSGRYKPILGYPAEFWASRTIFDLLHPDDAMRVLAMRAEVVARPGAVVAGEFSVRAADDSYQPLEVHAVNLLDDPDIGGIVVTSRNISKEKALLGDLAASRDAALAEAELRSRLIATVSHELRNPLHAMCGLAELLTTSSSLHDDAASLAHTLRRQIEGLTTVIDDLLDSSRLGVGAVSLTAQPVLLRGLVDDVVAMAGLGAREKPVDVRAEVMPGVPAAVEGDQARLRQVLSNLVGNAVKFTSAGYVSLRVAPAEGGVQFVVADTGHGIAAGEMASIFEPFTTGSNAGDGSGAGLGLTIVRQLVTLMRGTIETSSELGVGSRFIVTLPLAGCAPPPPVLEPTAPLAASAMPVLVVEDNSVNQMLAESQLARLGMQAVVVGSGEAALELLADGHGPHVVLMDYHLPGISGLEATRRLREMERGTGRHTVVIGVTASVTHADRQACADAGMDEFLSKPVGLSVLGRTMRRWVRPDALASELSNAVDERVLTELAADLGDDRVVVDLVRTFLDELYGRRAALAGAAADGDIVLVKRAAHTLRSSSLLLGARDLGHACQRMAAVAEMNEVERLTREILELAAEAARWFQSWLGQQPA